MRNKNDSKTPERPIALSAPIGSESEGFCREESDRLHHWFPRADAVAVDIYKTGEVVVMVKIGDRDIILECNHPNVEGRDGASGDRSGGAASRRSLP